MKAHSVIAGLRWLIVCGVVLASVARAQTSVFFVTDEQGRVGRFDTNTNTGTALGSLAASGFTAAQVIGLAFDPVTNSILLFDRNANKVYSMNALTGIVSVLFSTGSMSFQGGAVIDNTIFGVDEGTQRLAAFSRTGVNLNLTGPAYPDHLHNLGLIPNTGQLFVMTTGSGVRIMNPNGTQGAFLLAGTSSPEDIDYFNGNYLVATYTNSLTLMNGTTGATSTLLSSGQLTSMGVLSNVSGVAVQHSAIPEPGTWLLLLTGGSVGLIVRWRRRG